MKNKFKRASKPKKTTTLNRGNVLLRIWKTRKQVDSAACKIKSQFPICIARHSNGKLTVLNMEAANEKITMPQWKWRWLIRSLDGLVKYKLDIRLISGLELCVRAIRLYEANQVEIGRAHV